VLAGTKVCTTCRRSKPLGEFTRNRTRRDGHGSRCLTCHASRQRQLDRGEREPRSFEPTRDATAADVAWSAGFLDGDGCFDRKDGYLRIRAEQVDPEPLARLRAIFGGGLSVGSKVTSAGNPVWRWSVAGVRAERAADLLYPHLTARRKAQVDSTTEVR